MIAKLDVIIAILPLVFLIYLMTKRNSVASNVALPDLKFLLQKLHLS